MDEIYSNKYAANFFILFKNILIIYIKTNVKLK